ncbi:MAG: universal stress protein [Candidatus Brachytrichaceae bacterium NZ_4S206]|jgi:nucleotide-binding universal stress UspA family protein
MYRKILVPLDGSKQAECVLDIAGELARRAGAQLDLVHVSTALEAQSLAHDTYLERLAQQMAERWRIQTTATIVDDERFEPKLDVASALFQFACDSRADLVVMARLGRGSLVRMWLSSVSERIIRWCPVPVLLWRYTGSAPEPETLSAVRRIVVPLDGSRVAEEVLDHAIDMQRLLDAVLHLVRVIAPSGEAAGPARDYLDAIAAALSSRGVRVQTQLIEAESISQAILAHAAQAPGAMIAMSTHGYTGIARMLLGSVAAGVLDNATVPVMLFRPIDLIG